VIVSGQVSPLLVWLTRAKLPEFKLQLSEAVPPAVVKPVRLANAGYSIILQIPVGGVGQFKTGRTLSTTVTVCVQVLVFPELSVTVHVTVVTPTGKVAGALLLTEATPQLSPVVGVPRFTPVAVHPELVVVFILDGQVIVGGTISVTVTVCVHEAVFPELSVIVQITLVTPNGKEAGALLVTDANPQPAVVTGVPRLTLVAVHPVFVFVLILVGQVIVGNELMVTVCVAVVGPLQPAALAVMMLVPLQPAA
jgi:hypothetical protein